MKEGRQVLCPACKPVQDSEETAARAASDYRSLLDEFHKEGYHAGFVKASKWGFKVPEGSTGNATLVLELSSDNGQRREPQKSFWQRVKRFVIDLGFKAAVVTGVLIAGSLIPPLFPGLALLGWSHMTGGLVALTGSARVTVVLVTKSQPTEPERRGIESYLSSRDRSR